MHIMAGDMNAALFNGDAQRAKLDMKDTKHQDFVKDMRLQTIDPDKHPHRQYTSCHRTDGSQDSRIDDIFISESMYTGTIYRGSEHMW